MRIRPNNSVRRPKPKRKYPRLARGLTWEEYSKNLWKRLSSDVFDSSSGYLRGLRFIEEHEAYLNGLIRDQKILAVGTKPFLHYVGELPPELVVFMKHGTLENRQYLEYSFHAKRSPLNIVQNVLLFSEPEGFLGIQDSITQYCQEGNDGKK